MNGSWMGLEALVPVAGLISGLIGAYVGVQNRALLAEVRKEMAELENRVVSTLNGKYVRQAECHLREQHFTDRLNDTVEEVRALLRAVSRGSGA